MIRGLYLQRSKPTFRRLGAGTIDTNIPSESHLVANLRLDSGTNLERILFGFTITKQPQTKINAAHMRETRTCARGWPAKEEI